MNLMSQDASLSPRGQPASLVVCVSKKDVSLAFVKCFRFDIWISRPTLHGKPLRGSPENSSPCAGGHGAGGLGRPGDGAQQVAGPGREGAERYGLTEGTPKKTEPCVEESPCWSWTPFPLGSFGFHVSLWVAEPNAPKHCWAIFGTVDGPSACGKS